MGYGACLAFHCLKSGQVPLCARPTAASLHTRMHTLCVCVCARARVWYEYLRSRRILLFKELGARTRVRMTRLCVRVCVRACVCVCVCARVVLSIYVQSAFY